MFRRPILTLRRLLFIPPALALLALNYGGHCVPSPNPACQTAPSTTAPCVVISGDHKLTLRHDGRNRSYILHVPTGYDGMRNLPLVIMLHGGFGDGAGAARFYGWSEKADTEGFFVAYPDGLNRAWNAGYCCGRSQRRDVDDVGFLAAMIDEIKADVAVDPKRIYATGMSNGAMMSHRFAAERPNLVAAIGPVAGSIGGQTSASAAVEVPPAPASPVAVMIIHGTDDQHVLFEGGETVGGVVRGRIDLSVAESVQFWVDANGATDTPVIEPNAAGDVIKETHAAQGNYADVVLFKVVGQGHAWPGGIKPRLVADVPSTSLNATDELWTFFAAHPKP